MPKAPMIILFWRWKMSDLFTEEDLDQEALEKEKERKAAQKKPADSGKEIPASLSFDKRLYIIDGYSVIYRNYFAHISNPLTDKNGTNISAYFGFFSTLFSLMSGYRMDYLAVVMDEKEPTFRKEMYPEYKANRDKAPEDLHAQVPMIKETLAKMGISCLSHAGFEADDIIATLSRMATERGIETVMVTGDKDLLQLVDDHVMALRPPRKGESQYHFFKREEVKEEFGINPEQIVDYLSIIGDKADNVPGRKGLGEKGAVKLLSEYVTLEGIYRHIDMLAAGVRKKLEEGKADAELSKKLILLRFDALPSDFDITELSSAKIDAAAAAPDFEKRSCRSLLRRIGGDKKQNAVAETEKKEEKEDFRSEYQAVADIESVRKLFLEAEKNGGIIALDTETTGLEEDADIVGFSFSYEKGKAYYAPLVAEGREYLGKEDVIRLFDEFLASGRLGVINQNVKYDLKAIWHLGSDIKRIAFDTMIAAWMLDSNAAVYNLDELSIKYLSHTTIRYEDIVPEDKVFSDISLEKAGPYSAEDSDVALRLYFILSDALKKKDLLECYNTYELPLIRILASMEKEGIHLSPERIGRLKEEIDRNVAALVSAIYEDAGHEFNINSTQQLSKVLFEEKGLKAGKKTQKGYSTDTATLEGLREEGGKIIRDILEYRQLSKLKSTYIDVLPSLSDAGGRIHTSFLQTGTATGRLSSRNPNLQNIPVRTDEGRMIRSAFTPDDGKVFLSADYSQIELVVLADATQDKNLMDAFIKGVDVHRYTASLIFSKLPEEVSDHERRIAKTINFGIMYGMSAFRLSNELGISRHEAASFIETYFNRYSGVKSFVERMEEEARKNGYVRTKYGHVRDVLGINSSNKVEKAAAERVAVNTVIQGTAAEIMKSAMIAIDSAIRERNLSSRILLQVHDELIFEVPMDEKDEMEELVRTVMEGAASLSVPLRVSIETGASWGDMH